MKWYPIVITCPTCKVVAEIQSVNASADGEIQFICACHTCKALVHFEAYASTLQHNAFLNDLKSEKTVKPTKLISAAPVTPLANLSLTEKDTALLKEMHIVTDEEKT